MSNVRLRDLIKPAGRKAGPDVDLPVYSVTKHKGFVPSLTYFNKQVFSRNVEGYKVVEPGQFAYATIHLDEGSIGIAPERALISPMYTVFGVDDSRVDPGYLIRFLKSPRALSHYAQIGQGAVHRRKAISLSSLGTIPVQLPSIEEQRRIAGILDQADALRAKRHQVLAHMDTLTRSIFHSMFCGTAADQLKSVLLGDLVARIDSGASPNCETRRAMPGEWGVLKLGAVTYGHFQPEENKAFRGEVGSMAANEVRAGDVLMTRKNTRELVGAVALVDEVRPRLLLPDLIFRLHLDSGRIDRRYFQALMMDSRKRSAVRALASGSAASMPNISKARLSNLPIELPPLNLQREFAARANQVDAQRKLVQRASDADNELFASLQARAFRGEL
jgi:type I restriction enzyme, S subunit